MYTRLEETTKWDDNTPNHIYILNKQQKLISYIVDGELRELNKPIAFDKRRRTFNVKKSVSYEKLI
jgi:aspartyl aminopeptidase